MYLSIFDSAVNLLMNSYTISYFTLCDKKSSLTDKLKIQTTALKYNYEIFDVLIQVVALNVENTSYRL